MALDYRGARSYDVLEYFHQHEKWGRCIDRNFYNWSDASKHEWPVRREQRISGEMMASMLKDEVLRKNLHVAFIANCVLLRSKTLFDYNILMQEACNYAMEMILKKCQKVDKSIRYLPPNHDLLDMITWIAKRLTNDPEPDSSDRPLLEHFRVHAFQEKYGRYVIDIDMFRNELKKVVQSVKDIQKKNGTQM